jgi:hypothetical protein
MEEDLDISHYTTEEMLDILGLTATATRVDVVKAVADRILRTTDNPARAYFFTQMEVALLAKREFTAQGRTNTRLLNIDTYFRENIPADNLGTENFSFTLSDRLTGVTAITLLSVEIPQTWYVFTAASGTTGLVLQLLDYQNAVYTHECNIADGNYSNASLMAATLQCINDGFKGTALYARNLIGPGPWVGFTQDPINARLTMSLLGPIYYPNVIKIMWYDSQYKYASLTNSHVNLNLGWTLGFRYPSTVLNYADEIVRVTAPSIVVAVRTRYIIMKIDDHTANRLTTGMLTVGTSDQQIPLPSYLSETKIARNGELNSQISAVAEGPRRLTNKQLFTINAISTSAIRPRVRAYTSTTDVFAKIPIKHCGQWACGTDGTDRCIVDDGPGEFIIETAGMLQRNKRVYFGPVNLYSLTVSLEDDVGNPLNLNGHDWSCTLEIETLN